MVQHLQAKAWRERLHEVSLTGRSQKTAATTMPPRNARCQWRWMHIHTYTRKTKKKSAHKEKWRKTLLATNVASTAAAATISVALSSQAMSHSAKCHFISIHFIHALHATPTPTHTHKQFSASHATSSSTCCEHLLLLYVHLYVGIYGKFLCTHIYRSV